jgi:hypothetical protein
MNILNIKILEVWFKPRTVISMMLYCVFCYMVIRGMECPDYFIELVWCNFGFWFCERVIKTYKRK